MDLYEFIIDEFFGKTNKLSVSLDDNIISVNIDEFSYQEPFFDEQAKFETKDVDLLLNIVNNISENGEINMLCNSELDFLRLYYLITHEKYFIEKINYDKHNRVSSASLIPEFHDILRVPICNILKNYLLSKLGVAGKKKNNIYLTCDYDILNIWDVNGIRECFSWFSRNILRLKLINAVYIIHSYFFSRKLKSANGYLNVKMFETKLKCTKIAFFISESNSKIDCNANYEDIPVKNFISEVKCLGVNFGLHTNYNTKDTPNSVQSQLKSFYSKINSNKILTNRHHYLRFDFPNYLSTFENTSIEKDFSIYFAESMLFRCGISSEFRIWNEFKKSPFKVSIIPTTLMDVTFTDYLSLDEEAALDYAKRKLKLAYMYGDDIVLLWHNGNTFKRSANYSYHLSLFKRIIQFLESLDLPIENKK